MGILKALAAVARDFAIPLSSLETKKNMF